MQTIIEKRTVFSNNRKASTVSDDTVFNSQDILINDRNKIDGISLLEKINNNKITICFFDPQYRGIMDKMQYGNEGKRQIGRAELTQMSNEMIKIFIKEIDRVLIPSGHLFLWIDKFHLCEGISSWCNDTSLSIVDLIVWDKGKIGMGYRTRRKSEYLLVLQKKPIRAKGVWIKHNLPDVWDEKIFSKIHPHQKPVLLQRNLIEAVSSINDFVLDPCAGSYSVLTACKSTERNFIGGDIQ